MADLGLNVNIHGAGSIEYDATPCGDNSVTVSCRAAVWGTYTFTGTYYFQIPPGKRTRRTFTGIGAGKTVTMDVQCEYAAGPDVTDFHYHDGVVSATAPTCPDDIEPEVPGPLSYNVRDSKASTNGVASEGNGHTKGTISCDVNITSLAYSIAGGDWIAVPLTDYPDNKNVRVVVWNLNPGDNNMKWKVGNAYGNYAESGTSFPIYIPNTGYGYGRALDGAGQPPAPGTMAAGFTPVDADGNPDTSRPTVWVPVEDDGGYDSGVLPDGDYIPTFAGVPAIAGNGGNGNGGDDDDRVPMASPPGSGGFGVYSYIQVKKQEADSRIIGTYKDSGGRDVLALTKFIY